MQPLLRWYITLRYRRYITNRYKRYIYPAIINETSGIVRYYCMIPRFDAENNLLKDDTGRTLFELDREREFRYDNFDPVAKTCRFYFYDTVEGELCTVLNDSEMWFMYFGLAAAGNN